jgi:hypothetical protein
MEFLDKISKFGSLKSICNYKFIYNDDFEMHDINDLLRNYKYLIDEYKISYNEKNLDSIIIPTKSINNNNSNNENNPDNITLDDIDTKPNIQNLQIVHTDNQKTIIFDYTFLVKPVPIVTSINVKELYNYINQSSPVTLSDYTLLQRIYELTELKSDSATDNNIKNELQKIVNLNQEKDVDVPDISTIIDINEIIKLFKQKYKKLLKYSIILNIVKLIFIKNKMKIETNGKNILIDFIDYLIIITKYIYDFRTKPINIYKYLKGIEQESIDGYLKIDLEIKQKNNTNTSNTNIRQPDMEIKTTSAPFESLIDNLSDTIINEIENQINNYTNYINEKNAFNDKIFKEFKGSSE